MNFNSPFSVNQQKLFCEISGTADELLANYKKSEKTKNEFIENHSYLSDESDFGIIKDLKIDFKTLALLNGGTFVSGTPLDNGDTETGFNLFSKIVGDITENKKNKTEKYKDFNFDSQLPTIEEFQNELDICNEINTSIMDLAKQEQCNSKSAQAILINNMASNCQKMFKNKKIGWFPCSWNQNGVQQTILLRIDRVNGTVTIVNTGKSAEILHPSITDTSVDPLTGKLREQPKYQQFVTISGVDKNRLKHVDFYRYLISLQLGGRNGDINEDHLYESLPAYLEGSIDSGISPLDHPELFKKAETCNTGSINPISTMFYYMMCGAFDQDGIKGNTDGYKQVKYLVKLTALVKFCRSVIKDKKLISEEQIKLLNDMMEKLSRNASKLSKSGLLSEKNLLDLHATLLDIKKNIKCEKVYTKTTGNGQPVTCGLDGNASIDIRGEEVEVAAKSQRNIQNRVQIGRANTIQPLDKLVEHLNTPITISGEPEEMLSDLERSFALLTNSIGKYENVKHRLDDELRPVARQMLLNKFAEFICRLPDAMKDNLSEDFENCIWNKIPQDNVLECMTIIKKFMETLKNIQNLNGVDDSHEADITIMLYTLHSINIQLACRSKENKLDGFNVYYHDLLAEIRSPHFALLSSPLQLKLQSVIDFFDSDFNLQSQVNEDERSIFSITNNSLFDFNTNPPVKRDELHSATWRFLQQFIDTMKDNPKLENEFYHKNNGGRIIVEVPYQDPIYDEEPVNGVLVRKEDENGNDIIIGYRTRIEDEEREVRKDDSILQKLEALIGQRQRFLPEGVNLLLDATFTCFLHHHGQKNRWGQAGDVELSVRVRGKEPHDQLTLTIEKGDYNFSNNNVPNVKGICDTQLKKQTIGTDSRRHYHGDYYFDEHGHYRRRDPAKDQLLSNLTYMKKQNTFIPPQNQMLNLEVDATRELNMIGVDPYDVIPRLVAFCNQHMKTLEADGLLDLIRLHLFRNGQLISQLDDQLEMVVDLLFFFESAIANFNQLGKVDMCLSLAKLGNDVKVFIEQSELCDLKDPTINERIQSRIIELRKKNKIEDKNEQKIEGNNEQEIEDKNKLPDFRLQLIKLIKDNNQWSDKCKIYETLLSFYDNIDLDVNGHLQLYAAIDMLSWQVAKNMNANIGNENKSVVAFNARFKTLLINRIAYMSSAEINELFDSVVKVVSPKFDGRGSWKGIADNVYQNGEYAINIEYGLVTKDEKPFSPIPAQILNHADFKTVFQGQINNCVCEDDKIGSVFVINSGESNALTVSAVGYEGDLCFEKMIGNKKHRYIHTPDNLRELAPTLFNDNQICWLCENNLLEDPFISVYENGKEVFKIILDRNAQNGRNGMSYPVQKIVRENLQKNRLLKWVNSDCVRTLRTGLLNFGRFQANSEQMECWIEDDDQSLSEVKCHELGLSFAVKTTNDGQARFVCNQYPGYFLVVNPEIPLFENLKFITLENGEGDRKILVPCKFLMVELNGESLIRTVAQIDENGRMDFSPKNPVAWFDFELKENGLNTRSVEGRLALIAFYLARGDYSSAFELLNKTDSLGRFQDDNSPDGVKELKAIKALLALLFNDKHPAAQAMLLQLLVKVEENSLKYPISGYDKDGNKIPEPTPFWIEMLEKATQGNLPRKMQDLERTAMCVTLWLLYQEYYQVKDSHATKYRLTEEQENSICKMIKTAVDKNAAEGILAYGTNKIAQIYLWQNDRVNYLNDGVAKLGLKIQLTPSVEAVKAGGKLIDQLMEAWTNNENIGDTYANADLTQTVDLDATVILTREEIRDKFFAYYQIARLGSAKEREQLLRLLKLNAHLRASSCKILEKVCQNPSSYPSINDFNVAIQDIADADVVKTKAEQKLYGKQNVRDLAERNLRKEEYSLSEMEGKLEELERGEWGWYGGDYTRRVDEGKVVRQKELIVLQKNVVAESKEGFDKVNEIVAKAQRKADAAKSAYNNARSTKDSLFNQLNPGFFDKIVFSIKLIWKGVSQLLLNNFSLATNIYEAFYRLFKDRHIKAEKVKVQPMPLACEGSVLVKTDEAFTTYFTDLVGKYFDSKSEDVDRNGGHLPNVIEGLQRRLKENEETQKSLAEEIESQKIFVNDINAQESDRLGANSALTELEAQLENLKKESAELMRVKNLQKILDEENKDLEAYRDGLPETIQIYQEKSGKQSLKNLREELQSTLKTLNEQLKTQKTALLWQVNQLPHVIREREFFATNKINTSETMKWEDIRRLTLGNDLEAFRTHTKFEEEEAKMLMANVSDYLQKIEKREFEAINKIGQGKELKWEDIRQLTLKGDLEAFKAQTHLGEEEAKKLMVNVSDYLIRTTRQDQMDIVIRAIKKAENPRIDAKKKKMYVQNIVAAMEMERVYEPNQAKDKDGNPILDENNQIKYENNIHQLWFEAGNHLLYRGNQIAKLKEILALENDYKEVLAEMPTGWGKTKAGVPTLNFIKGATGEWLVVNTWPASLEMTNAIDVKEQMENSYGRKVDRLTFDRSTNITLESLKFMYSELIKDRGEGIPLNIRAESLRSFELHFLTALKDAREDSANEPAIKQRLEFFIKILREIRCRGWSCIDESHFTLDPKDKLIYTVKGKENSKVLSNEQMNVLERLFRYLTEEPINQLIDIRGNKQANVTEDTYNKIAGMLVKKFADDLYIEGEEKLKSFENFVLGIDGAIPGWVEALGETAKMEIALLKGELSIVLKSSIRGSVDENFGLSKLHIDNKEYAISYANANTPKETESNPSQFKNPHETMNKTYMTYLHKGLSKSQVKKFIKTLQKDAEQYCARKNNYEKSPANILFNNIVKNSPKTLRKILDEDIEALVPQIEINREAIFYYIRTIIKPQLKIYPKILVSTVHNFRSQFASSLSLSATPQAKATHGPDTYFVEMKGTRGKVTHILLKKNKDPETIHAFKATTKEDAQKESLGLIKGIPNIKATIDVGAYFKGASNYEVAQNMRAELADRDNVQAIIFFDEEKGLFKIMDAATGHLQDPGESQIDPDGTQANYDQARCFGSDLKLAIDAKGLLLTGRKTTKNDAGQSIGRLRQIEFEQLVEIAFPEGLKDDVFGGNQPDISQLLTYWLTNQVRKDEDSNYHSQGQQMENEIRRPLLDKILGLEIGKALKDQVLTDEVDVDRAINLAEKYDEVFFASESDDPWKMYAAIPEDQDTIDTLNAEQKYCKKVVSELGGLSSKEREVIYKRLDRYPVLWDDMILPAKVKTSSSGIGMECEVLQEEEVNEPVEQEVTPEEDLSERAPSKWPKRLNLFEDNWVRPQEHGAFMLKIASGLSKINNVMVGGEKGLLKHVYNACYIAGGLVAGAAVGAIAVSALAISAYATPIILGVGLLVATSMALVFYGSLLINFVLVGNNPLFKMRDLVKIHSPSNISDAAKFFDSNFIVSNNFMVQKPQGVFEQTQKPFDAEQKPLFELLVIQDTNEDGSKKIITMAIDQNDSAYFRQKLKDDNAVEDVVVNDNEEVGDDNAEGGKAAAVLVRKRKIAIYDIHNGCIVSQGRNKFEKNELEENRVFKGLVTQAKFLNGETEYEPDEIHHIESRAQNGGGIGVVGKMFESYILKQRGLNLKFFNDTPLANALALKTN